MFGGPLALCLLKLTWFFWRLPKLANVFFLRCPHVSVYWGPDRLSLVEVEDGEEEVTAQLEALQQ